MRYLCDMANEKGYSVEISSRYEGWWRYNVALTGGCFDAAGERIAFASALSEVAPVGSNLPARPADAEENRRVVLTTPPCDHLLLYVYVVPHTLPAGNDIAATRPFDIELKISRNGKRLRTEKRPINQWSGASLELRIGPEE